MSVFRLFCIFVLTASCIACGPEPRRTAEDYAAATPPLPLDEADPVVARVDGTLIRRSDVEREALAQDEDGGGEPPALDSADFERVLEELIDQRLLALEARRRGLHQSDVARRRLALAEERILGNVLVETAVADAVTEETIQRIYQEQIRLIPLGEEVRARHILVQTEEEAVAIKELLDQGRDFAELAVALSEDQATRLEGGDLGYFSREGILPAFGAVAFATPEGAVSEPFRTEFGWHVLMVVDRRRQPPPSLEALRANIARFYTFDQIEALIQGLRDEAAIERADLSLSLAPETPDDAGEGTDEAAPETPEEILNSEQPG